MLEKEDVDRIRKEHGQAYAGEYYDYICDEKGNVWRIKNKCLVNIPELEE